MLIEYIFFPFLILLLKDFKPYILLKTPGKLPTNILEEKKVVKGNYPVQCVLGCPLDHFRVEAEEPGEPDIG